MELEKTTVFTVDDKTYVVADLPPGFRKRFTQLDYMRQLAAQDAVKAEMSSTAANVGTLQMQEMIRQMLAAEAKQKAEAALAPKSPDTNA